MSNNRTKVIYSTLEIVTNFEHSIYFIEMFGDKGKPST